MRTNNNSPHLAEEKNKIKAQKRDGKNSQERSLKEWPELESDEIDQLTFLHEKTF